MNENAGLIVSVVSIASNMRPTIDHQYLFVTLACQPFGTNTPGKSGADDEPIKHERIRSRTTRWFPFRTSAHLGPAVIGHLSEISLARAVTPNTDCLPNTPEGDAFLSAQQSQLGFAL